MAMEPVCGWNVLLQVNGATVDTGDRQHSSKIADQITINGFAELKLNKDDKITVKVSADKKHYTIYGGDAVLQAQLLRWW